MSTIKAKDLQVGDRFFTHNGTIQEVIEIVKISSKTIEFKTNRISPNPYNGNFFNRPRLETEFVKAN
jgi:hypothetical protein